MKCFVAICAAGLVLAACSESTAPTATRDLSPRYGKKAPPTSPPVAGNVTNAKFDFAGATTSAVSQGGGGVNGTTITTDVFDGTSTASDVNPVPIYNFPSDYFVGRFQNTQTAAILDVPNGGSTYNLEFDFFAIGSWDGIGKQAQHGAFLANLFQIGALCPGDPAGSIRDIFTSTFSTQLTVQQNYPLPAASGGGAKALTGSYSSDVFFKGDPTVNVPVFRSVSDGAFHMKLGGTNPCGSGQVKFVFRTYAPGQQSAPDETWGIDNIWIKAD